VAISLIDLGTLPAITIIAPAAYVILTGMDLGAVEFGVAIALVVPAATPQQLALLVRHEAGFRVTAYPPVLRPAPCIDQT
jgi:hypothetical protein